MHAERFSTKVSWPEPSHTKDSMENTRKYSDVGQQPDFISRRGAPYTWAGP
jgi:hypothetical protein